MIPDYAKALNHVMPGLRWVMYENDPDTLEWYEDINKPTREQIESMIPELEKFEKQQANENLLKQKELDNKLSKLGLTVDDMKTILGV